MTLHSLKHQNMCSGFNNVSPGLSPPESVTTALQLPLVTTSTFLLLNCISCNPSAQSASKWKLLYIRNKIRQKTKSQSISFIALTETWFKSYSYMTDSQIENEHFTSKRGDRDARKGGRVDLLFIPIIPYLLLIVIHLATTSRNSFVCRFDTIKMVVSVIYRPSNAPGSSTRSCIDFLNSYIDDFNDDFESWLLRAFRRPWTP